MPGPRTASGEDLHNHSGEVSKVQKRHSFQTSSEGAKVWLDTMVEAIKKVDFSDETKQSLIKKISFLTQKMTK